MNVSSITNFSFLSHAESLTQISYEGSYQISRVASEILGRLSALLLSPAAALDICFHTLMMIPAFVYALGRSVYQWKADFLIPWQHLQRVRNAVAPLILGSAFGLLHPFAGLAVSEPTDKHAVVGMLSSNAGQVFDTPCSPVHSLSIVEDLAESHPEVFSKDHLKAIGDAKSCERSLEILQSQEWVHKLTNVTLFVMGGILQALDHSSLDDSTKEIVKRAAGLLIPVLMIVDIVIGIFMQAFYLAAGAIRWISGRGPIYTEVTTNPLMHLTFFFQHLLKAVGLLIGFPIWFFSPITAFRVSLIPGNLFFKGQMELLMMGIKSKVRSLSENERTMVPIVFGNGECSALSMPHHSMHKTYLIVERKNNAFNLYWVDRPNIKHKLNLSEEETIVQIRSMLDARFPFMDIEKMMNYPVRMHEPEFRNATNEAQIANQGNTTNCVVTNLFGAMEALDRIQGADQEISQRRYTVARKALMDNYGFYRDDFHPFAHNSSLKNVWSRIENHPDAPI